MAMNRDPQPPMRQLRPVGPRGGPHGLGMPVERAKDFKGTARQLVRFLRPYAGVLLIVALVAALSTLFGVISPRFLGEATTVLYQGFAARLRGEADAGVDFDALGRIVTVLVVLYLLSSLFSYVMRYIMAGVSQRIAYDLRFQVNRKLSRLPLKFFDAKTHGEIMSRLTNDVDTVASTAQQVITEAITSVVTLLGVFLMMLTMNVWLTLAVLLTLPLAAVVTRQVTTRSRPHFKKRQAALGELNGHVEEMFTGHAVVKAFGREQASVERFNAINRELYEAGWRATFISGIIMPLMNFIGNLNFLVVAVLGGIFAARGTIAVGDMQAFFQYSRRFNQPITQLAAIANLIQSMVAAAERIFELLAEEEMSPDPTERRLLTAPKGHVRFENVYFGYRPDAPLYRGLNLEVKPGQVVAIVGPTGAGKTTLVNLLMRFYEVDEGRITIDGVDIREMSRSELRSLFGMVLQDTWLFHGTIRDNIAYGRPDATDEEIVAAAKAAYADHFIRTLPDGYNTVLNEEASNLSQGQRQLITIARAFLANPPMLILDEATSNVDTRTELQLQRAMARLMQGRTSFVIAHRLSTIRDADIILVMNEGRLVEQGRHEELLARGGFYADLYYSQFIGSAVQPTRRMLVQSN